MVSPVSTASLTSSLRAQQIGVPANVQAPVARAAQPATKANAGLPPIQFAQDAPSQGQSQDLPRGSIIDITA